MEAPASLVRRRVKAVLMRAGTSKGLYFKQDDLPPKREDWTPILLGAMGSPDPFGKQLDGIGGGSSTTSKIAVVGRSSQSGVDVDYTFVAVPLGEAKLDFTGNCGNMASGVGPFAVEEGLIPRLRSANGPVTVSFLNTNTGVVMRSTFEVVDGIPVEMGVCVVDGVASAGSPIRLDFLKPAGSMTGKLLPSGHATDVLEVAGIGSVEVSLVDAANPFVFVHAHSIGLTGHESASALIPHAPTLMAIRCAGAVAMGLAKDVETASKTAGTPKVALIGPPYEYKTPSGRELKQSDMDLHVRPFSMGLPHPSLQMTGAVCLAAACAVPGSIPYKVMQESRSARGASLPKDAALRFGHASGIIETQAEASLLPDGTLDMKQGSVYRTARRLFEGTVYYLAAAPIAVKATPAKEVQPVQQQQQKQQQEVLGRPLGDVGWVRPTEVYV